MENPYPPHLSEGIRIKIALDLVRHDLKKLLPSLTGPEIWQKIIADTSNWQVDPKRSQLAPVRDFWNGIDGIVAGFKLKNVIRSVTAENISWTLEEEFPIHEIRFGSLIGSLEKISSYPNRPTASEAIAFYKDSPKAKEEDRARSDKSFGFGIPRDNDPIIVKEVYFDSKSSLVVTEGNGRLLRKILYDEETISAYIGRLISGQAPTNYWISTAYLSKIKNDFHNDREELIRIYRRIVKDSEAAKKEIPRALEGLEKSEVEAITTAVFGTHVDFRSEKKS